MKTGRVLDRKAVSVEVIDESLKDPGIVFEKSERLITSLT
jgi:hypothetical protein